MPCSAGRAEAMPGRSTPGSMRHLTVVAATAAPVWPAETRATASPRFTMSAAMVIELSFFARTATVEDSCISTTLGACTISTRAVAQVGGVHGGLERASSPVRMSLEIAGYWSKASLTPSTTTLGA